MLQVGGSTQRRIRGSDVLPLLLLGSLLLHGCMPAQRIAGRGGEESVETSRKALEEVISSGTLETRQRRLVVSSGEWLGTPYRWGGTTRGGVDCSGFVVAVFRSAGIVLPRTSQQQATEGRGVPVSAVVPGDLLFFNTSGDGVSHVGIALGEERFVHASSSRGVIVSSLREPYYRERFLFARRLD